MATGKVHTQVGKFVLSVGVVGVTAYSAKVGTLSPVSIGLVIGLILGFFITPDIDHHWTTVEEIRIYRLSKPLGFIWEAYWTPYRWLTGGHRGLSHWPIIGTLSKAIYISWIFWLTGAVTNYNLMAGILIGWLIQDTGHLLMDK